MGGEDRRKEESGKEEGVRKWQGEEVMNEREDEALG